jgi:hypothetical protein
MSQGRETVKPPKETRNAAWWVKLLVFLHVIAITSWALPRASPSVLNGSIRPVGTEGILYLNDQYIKPSPIQLYALSTGTWQSWDMFSPNPASDDIWADAEVVYKDGSVRRYQYPRMYNLPIVTKYIKERYRKFFEHANTDEYLWPAFAQRIALLNPGSPGNPAVKVILHRHWMSVPKTMAFDEYCRNVVSAIQSRSLSRQVLLPDPPSVPKEYNDAAYYEFPLPASQKSR